jgi:hypothetical protein
VIGGKPVVEAQVELFAAASGGFGSPMPTGTRSLVLAFPSLEHPGEEVKIGAMIDVVGAPALVPGAGLAPVVMRFWADEAAVYAMPGAAFRLWYGRTVGTGVVTRLADDVASA